MAQHANVLQLDMRGLLDAAQSQLLESAPVAIDYKDQVDLKRNQLPPSLKESPINVYALWKRASVEDKWELMYIGQRSHKRGWSRIKQHLFSTPKGTQSKLQEVRAAIEAGAEIGVTAILVEPDSLRLSVEEELIQRNSPSGKHLPWNRTSREKLPNHRKDTKPSTV